MSVPWGHPPGAGACILGEAVAPSSRSAVLMLLVLLLSHQVAYCKRMFGWFSPKIKLWATFNEPTCFAFVGYIASLWGPGKLMKFTLGGEVGVGAAGGGAGSADLYCPPSP